MGYNYPLPDIFYIWFHSSQIGVGFNDSYYQGSQARRADRQDADHRRHAARNALSCSSRRYVIDKALGCRSWIGYNYIALQPRVKGAFLDPRGHVILNNATLS